MSKRKVRMATIVLAIAVLLPIASTAIPRPSNAVAETSTETTYTVTIESPELKAIAEEQMKIDALKNDCKVIYDDTTKLDKKRNGFTSQVAAISAGYSASIEATQVAPLEAAKVTMNAKFKEIKKIVDKQIVAEKKAAKKAAIRKKKIAAINRYLKGSPMAGQGKAIYDSATKYGIDPRLVPAISCIESGKGKHCFRSHNAWGWGKKSWGSWNSAIWGVTKGIKKGYGNKSPETMQKSYCPPNSAWGHKVRTQMNKIY